MRHRLDNWERLLIEAIEKRVDVPFEYGKNDCVRTACDIVESFTSLRIKQEIPHHDTEQQAIDYAASFGGMFELVDRAMKKHGVHQSSVNSAGRGDLALVVFPDGRECLGVFFSSGIVVPTEKGLTLLNRRRSTHAWRIV